MKKIHRISPKEIQISRSEDGNESLIVEGYAAVYEVDSKPLGLGNGSTFIERIEKGAFDDAVTNISRQSRDCVATYEHQRSTCMARTSSNTLQLSSDEWGLKFRYLMPDTTVGSDVSVMLERKDLSQCSFIATVDPKDIKMYKDQDGNWRQSIKRFLEIYDISLVLDPAYDSTFVSEISRSIDDIETEEKAEAERQAEIQRNLDKEAATKESQLETLNNLITRAKL